MNRRSILAATSAAVSILLAGIADAQQPADLDAIKAANQAFYTALSARDLKAMEAIWANRPYVVNIGPRSKAAAVGYAEAVTTYWSRAFDFFTQMAVSSTSVTQIQTDGKIAWIVGIENAVLQTKSGGDPLKFDAFVTNIFEKEGDRWLMISHHAQIIPQ
jgi:ketosteroid isomerase-like protein